MAKILTKRKTAWADRRKPEFIKGTALQYNAAIQERYYAELSKIIKQMSSQTRRELERNFNAPGARRIFRYGRQRCFDIADIDKRVAEKFTQFFTSKAKTLAERMIDATDKATSSALHQSLRQLSGGLSLGTRVLNDQAKEIMKASIAENVSLIKSIPQQYFTAVEGAVMRSITTGNGLKDLVPFLKDHEGVTIKRARLIAGDQSRKAYANITASRMKELDVKKYIWRHSSAAEEARPLHLKLNGTIQVTRRPANYPVRSRKATGNSRKAR